MHWIKKQDVRLTDKELYLKAAGINFSIFIISNEIMKTLQKDVGDFSDLEQGDNDKVFFIVLYVVLFESQKLLQENFIKDENNMKIFESFLFNLFEKIWDINPRVNIKDIVDYIQRIGPSGEIRYIGSKICKTLGKESATLSLEISTIFTSYLLYGFSESIKRAWELPDEVLNEMLQKIETNTLLCE